MICGSNVANSMQKALDSPPRGQFIVKLNDQSELTEMYI